MNENVALGLREEKKLTQLERHIIEQALFPSEDCHQWLAYLILKQKYSQLTYLSFDGYSCDGLADHSKNILWQGYNIIDWTDKSIIIRTDKKFWEYSTNEICTLWMKVNGETIKTKHQWLENLK